MISTKPQQPSHDPEASKRIHLSDDKNVVLSSTISEIRAKQKEKLVEQNARQRGLSYVNLKTFPVTNEALLLLDRQFCEKERLVAFVYESEQIRLGTTNPDNPILPSTIEDMSKLHRCQVALYMISEESLQFALHRYDAIPKAIEGHEGGIELTEEDIKKQLERITSIHKLNDIIADSPITDVLTIIIGSAIKAGASDIHIEAEAEDIKIRLRIDGVLHDIGILPTSAWGRVISRIKLVAGLKLNINDKPQDGRFTIYIDQEKIEVRVSTVPTSYGESVVMRLLRFSIAALQFDALGITGFTLDILMKEIAKPNGMIIATGPTGSGKTTTLYAILHNLNNPETKILTLEDPIEYKIKGINQTQINPRAGLDFAKGLRSLLRQDPDIIMVGEIRDLETADTAINAALTGHLMLSTLHTNSSAGAVPRFLAMGSKSFLLAPAINAIIGQRLVRRLCPVCKKGEQPDAEILNRIKETLDPLKGRTDLGVSVDLEHLDSVQFFTHTGCDECNGLGFKGRVGIFEILTMNKDLEKLILGGNVSESDIQETSQVHGMITMLQDGLLKAATGITSIAEIFRQAE